MKVVQLAAGLNFQMTQITQKKRREKRLYGFHGSRYHSMVSQSVVSRHDTWAWNQQIGSVTGFPARPQSRLLRSWSERVRSFAIAESCKNRHGILRDEIIVFLHGGDLHLETRESPDDQHSTSNQSCETVLSRALQYRSRSRPDLLRF